VRPPIPEAADGANPEGEIDPSAIFTHRLLFDAPKGHKTFRDKEDGCVKVVLKP